MLSSVLVAIVFAAPVAQIDTRLYDYAGSSPPNQAWGIAGTPNGMWGSYFSLPAGYAGGNQPEQLFGWAGDAWTWSDYAISPRAGTPWGTMIPVRVSFVATFDLHVSYVDNLEISGAAYYSSWWGTLTGPAGEIPITGPIDVTLVHEGSEVVWLPATAAWEQIGANVFGWDPLMGEVSVRLVDPALPGSAWMSYSGWIVGTMELDEFQPIASVPEPATAALVAMGLAAMWIRRRAA